jgi:hypothetical protein
MKVHNLEKKYIISIIIYIMVFEFNNKLLLFVVLCGVIFWIFTNKNVKENFDQDRHEKCEFWASNGRCNRVPAYMLKTCPVSCNNQRNLCNSRVSKGECYTDPANMLVNCPDSCIHTKNTYKK